MSGETGTVPVLPIVEVGRALSSSAVLEEALANVVHAIGEIMNVAVVDIWAYSGERDAVTHEACWSRDGADAREPAGGGHSLGLGTWPDFTRLIESREPIERHIDDPELPADVRTWMESLGYKSKLDAPLVVGDQVMGILGLTETREVRRFRADELDLFAALCRFAAAGAHSADLLRHKEDRERRLLALLKTSRSMARSMSAQETIQGMRAEIAGMLAGIDGVEVYLRAETGSYERFLPPPVDPDANDKGEALPEDLIMQRAIEGKRPVQGRISGGRTRIVLPVVFKDEATGYIDLRGRLTRNVTGDDVRFLQTLADQAAVALENARLARAVERQAATDVVTGLHSRWYFFERLYSETARSYRYKEPLGLLLIEIDKLDHFREVRGQKDADEALRAIARILNNIMRRKVDIACRFGPATFAVLMPNTRGSSPGAALAAERLRATVESTEFRNEAHEILGRFTLSIGVGGYPHHADDGDELVEVAEKALGQARAAGNRVKLYAPYEASSG